MYLRDDHRLAIRDVSWQRRIKERGHGEEGEQPVTAGDRIGIHTGESSECQWGITTTPARQRCMPHGASLCFTIISVYGIAPQQIHADHHHLLQGASMNITAIVIIFVYFAIIIVPFVLVVRQSLREISRMMSENADAPERRKTRK